MCKSISLNQFYLFVLQICLAITLLSTNQGTVCANALSPEIAAASDNENDYMMQHEDERWDTMKDVWGKREANYNPDLMANGEVVPVLAFFANPAQFDNDNMDDEILTQKRGWGAGNIGKREPNLDDLRSILNQKRGWKKMNEAWGAAKAGKREPNWNNLRGMWGKRMGRTTTKDWNKLGGSWGKRSAGLPETN